MPSEVLAEEFEVLDSIYPSELTSQSLIYVTSFQAEIAWEELSDKDVEIVIEPDEQISGEDDLRLLLNVTYPDAYPDVLPELSLNVLDGALDDQESGDLMSELTAIGKENIGMAMTFTLISHLREKLSSLLLSRLERKRREATEQERLELEAEEARTRGTPVTPDAFLSWKSKFDKEMTARRTIEQEERLKGLPGKERDELRKVSTRLTGRQLFERDRNLATSDATLIEEGTISIDISQYDRTVNEPEAEEHEGLQFSDSD